MDNVTRNWRLLFTHGFVFIIRILESPKPSDDRKRDFVYTRKATVAFPNAFGSSECYCLESGTLGARKHLESTAFNPRLIQDLW